MKLLAFAVLLFVLTLWALALGFSLTLWIPIAGTLVCALAVGTWWFLRRLRAERASRALESALADQAESLERRARPDRQPALRALSAQFQAALSTLRSSKLAHGHGGALYALPWYVIIGPPGTGKSTAIRESGLSFPLAGEQGGVRGIGGTRHCDWWLTNEAILLDTAGRYATGDDDRDEWLAFLDMLRRARPKRPLNGLIVALSAGEVSTLDATGLAELSARVRARIDEVMARLEVRLPIYVLLTKCDLLPGFSESFAELRSAERGQVLGFTLPVGEGEDLRANLDRHWLRLVQTLERRAVAQLAQVNGTDARQAVYGFPQQLEQLAPRVTRLLLELFVDNVFRDAPILRGVYLTSGTQAAEPLSKLAAGDRKSYFLSELFRGVMFPDSALAVAGAGAQLRSARARGVVALAVLTVALGFAFASARAFATNRQLLRAARQELDVANAAHSERDVLAALAPLRSRLQALQEAQRDGTASELGLNQRASLLPTLQGAYTSALRAVLLQPLVGQLALQLAARGEGTRKASATAQAQSSLFDRTKAYLLLTQPKAAHEPQLDGALSTWLEAQLVEAWIRCQGEPVSSAQRSELAAHIASYLALLASDPQLGFARTEEPVRTARAELSRVPPVNLALDRVVAAVEPLGLELEQDDLLGGSGMPWHARGRIRGAFTRRGWEGYVRTLLSENTGDLVGEAWVVDAAGQHDGADAARTCALRGAYFTRYVEEWRSFLNTLQMEEPADQDRALAMLQDLTRGQPAPTERIMRVVADNARLASDAPALPAQAEGMLDQLRKRVSDTPVAALVARNLCAGQPGEESVRHALEGFYAFGASSEPPPQGAPAPVTSAQIYQEQLAYLRDAMQAATEDPTQGEALLSRASSVRTRVRSLIEAQPIGWRPRFERLLWPAVNGSSASAASALAGEQARGWCSSVVLPHARTLRDRYPFARRGQDAALTDLADFYRPGTGTLWTYYGAVLQRDLPQTGADFEPRVGPGVGTHYTPELVRFLHRAQALSNALFPPRAETPRVDLEIRVRPAPGIAQVLLTVDGQLVDFHNGPERWIRVAWPGTSDRRGASLRVRGEGIDETVVQDGEWGLFRLLEQSEVEAPQGERFFSARWRLHTQHDVVVDMRPARSENPLVGPKGFLELFRGPGVEVPRALTREAKACRE
ncbi:MAG TPA: type VI secretion system membrane subunit TssM [Polyangiales bacterium]|nr:type VI secretion system membrane subunit TssM [Polyangiales bacterium]